MIDSSKWAVIEAGLKCVQGKGVVNSISLKEGEEEFVRQATLVRRYGAAVDRHGLRRAGPGRHRRAQGRRSAPARYRILTERVGFPPEDIIFDPNIFAIATGIEEHNNYAVDYIEATRRIKATLPHAQVSGGVSNVSFSFRGNDPVREAIHAVFLYHAIEAAWTWASSTPASSPSTTTSRPSCSSASRTWSSTAAPTPPSGCSTFADQVKGQASARRPTISPGARRRWRSG